MDDSRARARVGRALPSLLACVTVAGLGVAVAVTALEPRAPETTAGGAHGHHATSPAVRSVTDLTGPRDATPDVRITLTARHAVVTLASGATVDALTFDGTSPGPELRVTAGSLVEVTLRNADVAEGVTLHWHGLDVPNAEDGVAGVTQDAVPPGGEHVYRFRPGQVGTFWYHSHQDSSLTVPRGLFGALVVEPQIVEPVEPATGADLVLLGHSWPRPGDDPIVTIGTADGPVRRDVPAGATVRARLVNTDSTTQDWTVTGATVTVVGIDGTDVNGPTPLPGALLRIPAGGRIDVAFTGPATVTLLAGGHPAVGVGEDPTPRADPPLFDPLGYGAPGPVPFPVTGPFDRDLEQVLDNVRRTRSGFTETVWTINGELHPPPAEVVEGELVRVTLRNDGTDAHPMHLHGHHVLVLSRNGVAASGSLWWADTVLLEHGDTVVVAFRADNPGIWMDHCHNLTHAAAGMVMHLAYAGVGTPFVIGGANTPE